MADDSLKANRIGRTALVVSRFGRPVAFAVFALTVAAWAPLLAENLARELRFEDAYIVLRYALNLAAGEGFVFNVGERVLGVTTPLYTLISTSFIFLGGKDGAPVLQNLAGLLALAVQAWLVLRLGDRLGSLPAGLVAAVLTLANFNLVWLYLGMETHLFTALLLGIFWLHLGTPRIVRGKDWTLGALLGLAFLVRFDAAAAALLIGLSRWHASFADSSRRDSEGATPGRLRRVIDSAPWALVASFAVVVVPWLLFAELYFGSFIPRSLGAKQGQVGALAYLEFVRLDYDKLARAAVLATGMPAAVADAMSRLWPVPVAVGVAALAARGLRFAVFALYPFLHLVAYSLLGADPRFTWHWYPLNPWLFLLAAMGFASVAHWLMAHVRLPTFSLVLRGLASLLVVVLLGGLIRTLLTHARHPYVHDAHSSRMLEIAAYLRDRYPPTTSLLQPSIGILGYESGLRMVDHAGLVTPGLYYWNDRKCTPFSEVVSRYAPDLVLLAPWTATEPERFGYRETHDFGPPFAYRLYAKDDASMGASASLVATNH